MGQQHIPLKKIKGPLDSFILPYITAWHFNCSNRKESIGLSLFLAVYTVFAFTASGIQIYALKKLGRKKRKSYFTHNFCCSVYSFSCLPKSVWYAHKNRHWNISGLYLKELHGCGDAPKFPQVASSLRPLRLTRPRGPHYFSDQCKHWYIFSLQA